MPRSSHPESVSLIRTRTQIALVCLLLGVVLQQFVIFNNVISYVFDTTTSHFTSAITDEKTNDEGAAIDIQSKSAGGADLKKDEKVAMVENTTQFRAPLPNHCSGPINGEIVLRGERHSGTNWIRKIISDNLVIEESTNKTKILMDSVDFGWKHGFLYPDGWGKPLSENEFLVIVTRDVFTWLPKIMKNAYDPIMNRKRGLGFSKYLREEYGGICQPRSAPYCREFNKKKNSPYEKAANIIQLRTLKYKQAMAE
jgi:hypothetical protein